MGNVEVAFARDELCLTTRLGGEIFSSKEPGLDWGIRESFACGIRNPGIFFLFWNPESWALDSGIQLKEKIHALELNPHASSTDKESAIPNPRRGIQKTKIVLDSLTWTETSGGSGGGARGARPPYF